MTLIMDFELKNKNEIVGTCWIEFNISGTASKYYHGADNSKYLQEYAYNLFTDIFEQYTDKFNYYGPTQFETEQLVKIKQVLIKRFNEIEELTTVQDLINYSEETINSPNLANELRENYKQLSGQEAKIKSKIQDLAQNLTKLIDKCIMDNNTLWILGL